jgi:hypothetical protein
MSELHVCRFCGQSAVDAPPVMTPLFGGTKILGFVGCSSRHHGRKGNTSKCYFYMMSTKEEYEKIVEKWNEENPHKTYGEYLMNRELEDFRTYAGPMNNRLEDSQ